MSDDRREDPLVLVFDVNETLSDLTPLRDRFEDVGAPAELMPTWFAGVLRDGFALTAAGAYADFASIARDGLRAVLSSRAGEWTGDVEGAVRHVMDGFGLLDVHPDVPDGVRKLSVAGFRLMTMTNGSARLTEQLLAKADLLESFEALLDVGGPQCWKPAPAPYRYVVEYATVPPERALLVAVHPWDVDGALRAGLGGAWLRRDAVVHPQAMSRPTYSVRDLRELADILTADKA